MMMMRRMRMRRRRRRKRTRTRRRTQVLLQPAYLRKGEVEEVYMYLNVIGMGVAGRSSRVGLWRMGYIVTTRRYFLIF
jgi:hypothetical protein